MYPNRLTLTRPAAGSDDYAAARQIQRRFGTSYFFATRLFPPAMRRATHALYAFFRLPDEIVDNIPDPDEARRRLEAWIRQWERTSATGASEEPALRAAADVFRRYRIPREEPDAFLSAMLQDLTVTRYETYADLKGYMFGSAAVVGRMMARVISFSDPATLPFAESLGYAMQLTNFLRDIDEDFVLRGRIYLPREDRERFGVCERQIAARCCDGRFRALMRFEAARARGLYAEARQGIPLLHPDGRFAVAVAAELYEAILDRLEAQDWNPFAGRARTSLPEKLARTVKVRLHPYA